MPDISQNTVILGLAFVSTILLIEAFYYLVRAQRNSGGALTRRRLKAVARGRVDTRHDTGQTMRLDKEGNESALDAALPSLKKLRNTLERAAPDTSPGMFFLYALALGITVFVVSFLFVEFSFQASATVAGMVAILIPLAYLTYKSNKYKQDFNEQLPDAMDYLGRSLRAGHPFTAALKSISEDMAEPLASEFGIVFDEIKYGMDAEVALQNLIDRTESEEIKFFVTAVMVNRTTGGNLAKILERLSAVMRSRATTRREIVVLSTEMRYSANILMALPFVVAAGVTVSQPDYFTAFLASSTGRALIMGQAMLMIFGYIIIRRMVNLKI